MRKVKVKSKIAVFHRNNPNVWNSQEKCNQHSYQSNILKIEPSNMPTSSINVHNETSLFHYSKQDECKIVTTDKIEKARKTGQLKLNKANLCSIPKKVFTIDKLCETEAKRIEVTLDESTGLHWWEFKPLEKLDLSFNSIKTVPDNIRELAELRMLDLQHNCIDEISDEICTLNHMQYLNLNHNKLTTLPKGIYKLHDLKELLAEHNLLQDLHEDIGDLSCLLNLDLSYNSLTCIPNGIGFLSSLKELNLSYNQLATLPSDFSGLCGLTKLNLRSNHLRELPSFEHLINLSHVDIGFNCLEGLPNLENCIMLDYLDLSHNSMEMLNGNIVSSWSRLKQLNIKHNQITELPDEVCTLFSLIMLDVSMNKLTKLPEELVQLPELRCLRIQGNKIADIPSTVVEGDLLRYLRKTLSFHKRIEKSVTNDVSSVPPLPSIYDLRKTQHLKYSDFNAAMPDSLIKDAVEACVKSVDISKNKLKEFSPGLEELQNDLQVLDASFNCLSNVPLFVGVFNHLNALILNHNHLTNLPSALADCKQLKELYIDFNRFTVIPDVVYKLVHLERLSAESNTISHVDIEGLKELRRLAYLELSNNSINKVPPELGCMKHIMYLGLTGNLFRHPNYEILRKPTTDLLQYLRDRL